MNTVRVLLVDYGNVIMRAVREMLADADSMELLIVQHREGMFFEDIRRECRRFRPDVVICDANVESAGCTEIIGNIHAASPATSVVVAATRPAASDLLAAMSAGARGYLVLAEQTPESLRQSIERVVSGDAVMNAGLLQAALGSLMGNTQRTAEYLRRVETLTARELQVLSLVAIGLTNREIGGRLSVSVDAVKNHVSNIAQKLNARDRSHAAAIGAYAGVVLPETADGRTSPGA